MNIHYSSAKKTKKIQLIKAYTRCPNRSNEGEGSIVFLKDLRQKNDLTVN